ncbi:MAG TPA: MarR family transcriptional regulator [Micromonosporaceae bacterium]
MTEPDNAELTARLQRVLGRLSRVLRREAPSALGPGALAVLSTLAAEGPLRPTDLAGREGVRPPTMTRMLTALEEGGYVARTLDPVDRRASLIALTPVGAQTLLGTRSERAGQLARHLAQLSPAQRRALAQALPALEYLAGIESPAAPAPQPPPAVHKPR